ncbi:MAG: hypothetical protein M3525_02405 [Acidobacteriota bacterium]|nr:hypothetical protein [Acidobacteriota bacterium]
MSNEKTNSWIFLAVGIATAESSSKLREIVLIADGINHAVPTQKELQIAFKWLSKQHLVLKERSKYRVTETGLYLFEKAKAKSNLILQQWKYIEEHFLNLSNKNNV